VYVVDYDLTLAHAFIAGANIYASCINRPVGRTSYLQSIFHTPQFMAAWHGNNTLPSRHNNMKQSLSDDGQRDLGA
jgi:hypothetical protein